LAKPEDYLRELPEEELDDKEEIASYLVLSYLVGGRRHKHAQNSNVIFYCSCVHGRGAFNDYYVRGKYRRG